jgi:hypothetical protein
MQLELAKLERLFDRGVAIQRGCWMVSPKLRFPEIDKLCRFPAVARRLVFEWFAGRIASGKIGWRGPLPVRLMGMSWLAGPFQAWCRRDVERCCPVSSPLAGCPRVWVGRPNLGFGPPSQRVGSASCN